MNALKRALARVSANSLTRRRFEEGVLLTESNLQSLPIISPGGSIEP